MVDEDFPSRTSAFGAWIGFATPTLWAKPVEREGLCILTARKGQADALKDALRMHYSLDAPAWPACVFSGDVTLIATAPDSWLLIQPASERNLATSLNVKLMGLASIADQSGAYARLRLGGSSARALLQKGLFLDLHPDIFSTGAAAVTHAAHIGVTLWKGDPSEAFDLAIFRSHARDFLHWLESARLSLRPIS